MNDAPFHLPDKPESKPAALNRLRRFLRGLGLFLLLAAVLASLYGAVAYIAWQRGQVLRAERARADLQAQLAQQMSLADSDVAAGNFALAVRRLDWVLEHDPHYPGGRELREQANQSLHRLLTPLPTRVVTPLPPVASHDPDLTPAPAENSAAGQLAAAQALLQDEAWEKAITALLTLQSNHPNYERRQTDQMLYDSYVNLGVTLLYGDQMEVGLHYLDRAERLGDLSEAVNDQRAWAKLYLQGIAFYGVNWPVAIYYFRDLCLAAPFFHNACDRLHESLVSHGDQYAAAEDWCPALPLYTEARQRQSSPALVEKARLADEGCLAATPTPLPESEDELAPPDEDEPTAES